MQQRKYEESEPLFKRSLQIDEKYLGKEHPTVAMILSNISALYIEQNRYSEAEQLHDCAAAIFRKKINKNQPSFADKLNNIGFAYYKQGLYEKTEPFYKRSLAINEAATGREHDVAINLNNIAEIYRHQGKYEEAEPLFQRALSILKQKYPDDQAVINRVQEHYDDLKKSKAAKQQSTPPNEKDHVHPAIAHPPAN